MQRPRRAAVAAVLSLAALATPVIARAIDVSGTVTYAGAQGPVTADRPILVAVLMPDGSPVTQTMVASSPGAFTVGVPAPGEYVIGTLLDAVGDDRPSVGEPFAFFDRQPDPTSATRVSVPAEGIEGLEVTFDDGNILTGIAATVTYTGTAGEVSPERPLRLLFFNDAGLTERIREESVGTNGGRIEAITLDTSTYYVLAFFDANGNEQLDGGDPFTIYDGRSEPPADPVQAGATLIAIAFGDENVEPTAAPTATPTATLAAVTPTASPMVTGTTVARCIGDCDGDHLVVVNELIRGVNIALGNLAVEACASFDADGNGAVAVNELVRAVANALGGC